MLTLDASKGRENNHNPRIANGLIFVIARPKLVRYHDGSCRLERRIFATEIFMTRAILTLLLMATQLLSVSGDALYLCVRDDGSTCCVDGGPESCNCCHDADVAADTNACAESACASHGSDDDHGLAVSCCDDHDDVPVSQFPAVAVVLDGECGCTHIPLAVASEQPTVSNRQGGTADIDFHVFWLAPVAGHLREIVALAADRRKQCRLGEAPPIDFALKVISTIVIRC